jgi:hypothetical protein
VFSIQVHEDVSASHRRVRFCVVWRVALRDLRRQKLSEPITLATCHKSEYSRMRLTTQDESIVARIYMDSGVMMYDVNNTT